MEWRSWYDKARNKGPYKLQAEELFRIINTHVGMSNIKKVLDVGCGDCRLQPMFGNKDYWGLDKEYNDFELISDEWKDVPEDFDIGVSSLVLMLFDTNNARFIFDEMMKRCKFVVLYEENPEDVERQNPHDFEKFYHSYPTWSKNIVVWGKSNINPNWAYYVFKGKK